MFAEKTVNLASFDGRIYSAYVILALIPHFGLVLRALFCVDFLIFWGFGGF